MRVLFTPTGRRQFLEAVAYIYRENPTASLGFRRKAERKLSLLKEFPESGRLVPEYPDLPFREVIVRPYRFFYRIKNQIVWVVAVWHSAQLPEEPEHGDG
ncbi:MAG: type II toxin-antitoxin system RelE/ParE family toxin [Armatimonadetes bacterium]|nr:type II toxin-antitoxin system RelE/ParE family toxin [Armatimonadota bacterium]